MSDEGFTFQEINARRLITIKEAYKSKEFQYQVKREKARAKKPRVRISNVPPKESPKVGVRNHQLAQLLQEHKYQQAQALTAGEDENIIELVDALALLLGDNSRGIGGALGVLINHALQNIGINRADFARRTSFDDYLLGRLQNHRYRDAAACVVFNDVGYAPEVKEVVFALDQIMINPGCYSGALHVINAHAVSNISDE